jgi:glycerophosphoryl diester phosphodiesterase
MRAPDWLTARPIAHRGLHDRSAGVIENAMAAFAAAAAQGFAAECDVQISADGEAMVFHDFDLGRLTSETGAVSARTAAELQRIPLSGSEAGDTIRPLAEVLDRIAGRAPLVVEIKSRFDGDLALTRRVAEVLAGRPEPVAVKSFDPRVVAALRMLTPDRPRGIVAMSAYEYPDYAGIPAEEKRAMANLLHFTETLPDFLSWSVKDLPHCGPFLCRSQLGLPVMAWTVRTDHDRQRAARHSDQMVFEGFTPG